MTVELDHMNIMRADSFLSFTENGRDVNIELE